LGCSRRTRAPIPEARLSAAGKLAIAVVTVGVIIAALVFVGAVRLTWSFSAFTVLVYYAITNLAALRPPADEKMFSPLFACGGLASCLFLTFESNGAFGPPDFRCSRLACHRVPWRGGLIDTKKRK